MNTDVFGHATVDAVSAQYISQMNHQVAPSLEEAIFAFSQAFSECKGNRGPSHEEYLLVANKNSKSGRW